MNPVMSRYAPLRQLLPLFLLSIALSVAARQETGPVKKAVEDFLQIQTRGLPGQASFVIGNIEAQNNLAPCPAFEVSLPPGARAWGNTNVNVRCQVENGWSIFVSVRIRVIGEYLVTTRPLSQGQVIVETDLAKSRGDLASLPAGIVTDIAQAVGKSMAISVSSGQPLRNDLLKQPMVVQQGQSVRVLSKGPGFQVTSGDGRALNNAIDGQVVQVRIANGHVVSGIARPGGVVEVSY